MDHDFLIRDRARSLGTSSSSSWSKMWN